MMGQDLPAGTHGTKHTPGPWTIQEGVTIGPDGAHPRLMIFPPDDEADVAIVAELGHDDSAYPQPIMQANAELIVRACNSHAELLKACKTLLALWPPSGLTGPQEIEAARKQARAAIAKAGKEGD